jgi:hypothetical protein
LASFRFGRSRVPLELADAVEDAAQPHRKGVDERADAGQQE